MKRSKILLVSPTGGYSGVDVCFEQLIKGIDREYFEPIVLVPENSYIEKKLKDTDIKFYNYPLIWWFPPSFDISYLVSIMFDLAGRLEFIKRIIIEEDIKLVLSNTTVFFDAAIAAQLEGIPHIFHMHASFVGNIYTNMEKDFKKLLYIMLGRLSHKIITPSNQLREFMKDFVGDDKVNTIYNSVDSSVFYPNENSHNQVTKISCIGHLNENKNQLMIVNAFAKIAQKYPKVRLYLIGPYEPEYITKLKNRIIELEMLGQVFIDDFREDVPEVLRNTDIYINSSITETFPVSIIEAQASGLPVVATMTEGAREIVVDGVSGFIVSSEDEMAAKLELLIKSKELYKHMSMEAVENFKKRFQLQNYQSSFNRLFVDTIKQVKNPINIENNYDSFILKECINTLIHPQIQNAKKRNILVITPNYEVITYYILIEKPFNILKENGIIEYTVKTPSEIQVNEIYGYDLIVNLRCFDANTINVLRHSKVLRIPFIFITDDNYFELGFVQDGGKLIVNHSSQKNINLEKVFKESNSVIVFSEELKKRAKLYSPNVFRIKTYQVVKDEYNAKKIDEKSPIRIGFMGSLHKDIDFEFVEEALLKIMEEYSDKVQLEFMGFIPENLKGLPNVKHFSFIPDYDTFIEFFKSREWDIGLAPLANTAFNRSKTNNKFREYSALGVPGIYSNIITYNEDVRNKENGLLANNNKDAWYDGLKELIDNPKLREKISFNAFNYVKTTMTMKHYIRDLLNVFSQYPHFSKDAASYIKQQSEIIDNLQKLVLANSNILVDSISGENLQVPLSVNNFIVPSKKIKSKRVYYIDNIKYDNWSGIKVVFGTHYKEIKGKITLSIYHQNSKVCTVNMNAEEVEDNQWVNINFPIKINSINKCFRLVFEFNLNTNEKISIYETKSSMSRFHYENLIPNCKKKALYGYFLFN